MQATQDMLRRDPLTTEDLLAGTSGAAGSNPSSPSTPSTSGSSTSGTGAGLMSSLSPPYHVSLLVSRVHGIELGFPILLNKAQHPSLLLLLHLISCAINLTHWLLLCSEDTTLGLQQACTLWCACLSLTILILTIPILTRDCNVQVL